MALCLKPTLLLTLACLLIAIHARELPGNVGSLKLEERLEGGFGDCWSAMMQLRSCTNEIVLFFLNGESYLGQDCCRAIRIITHQCWPSMLSSVGFTAEEGDILQGYCDAGTPATPNNPSSPPPSLPPVAALA